MDITKRLKEMVKTTADNKYAQIAGWLLSAFIGWKGLELATKPTEIMAALVVFCFGISMAFKSLFPKTCEATGKVIQIFFAILVIVGVIWLIAHFIGSIPLAIILGSLVIAFAILARGR